MNDIWLMGCWFRLNYLIIIVLIIIVIILSLIGCVQQLIKSVHKKLDSENL